MNGKAAYVLRARGHGFPFSVMNVSEVADVTLGCIDRPVYLKSRRMLCEKINPQKTQLLHHISVLCTVPSETSLESWIWTGNLTLFSKCSAGYVYSDATVVTLEFDYAAEFYQKFCNVVKLDLLN